MQREKLAKLIPDWAAWLFAGGVVLAIGGFIAAWLVNCAIATMVMAVGLIASAIGLRKAEHAIGTWPVKVEN
ncbi:MAG: hypothetical protein P8Y47_07915 [Alphaproteobacteria bacterium]